MNWLETLLDEYYNENRSDQAIERLNAAFSNQLDIVMDTAVLEYMKAGEQFFPRIAGLVPYVERVKTLDYAKANNDYTIYDELMLRAEVANGTMDESILLGVFPGQPTEEELAAAMVQTERLGL